MSGSEPRSAGAEASPDGQIEPRSVAVQAPTEVQIGYLLARLGARQGNALGELLRPIGLRAKQYAIMNIVALGNGLSQQQVGASMELDPSGLIATIDELSERGWLERRRDASDRRRHALHLTHAGLAKLEEGRAVARARARALTAPLSADERSTLLTLLRKLD